MSESEEADVISNHNQTIEETKSNTSAIPKLHKIQELDCENDMSFQ